VRTVVVTLTAPSKDFSLPDLLSEEGAIDPYEVTLREAVKEATEEYLQGAKAAVAAIAERKQGGQMPAPARGPKGPDAGKGLKPKPPVRPEEPTQAPVSRAVPERVNGPVPA
jgi:hypothetical protein